VWSSIRAIEESYMLMDHVASDPGSHGLSEADARDLTARARLVQDQLEVLHRVLDQLPSIGKP
jgi:hypothetical protein